jgi:hypothetical protein
LSLGREISVETMIFPAAQSKRWTMEGTRAKKTNGSGKTAKLAKVRSSTSKPFSSVGSTNYREIQAEEDHLQQGDPADAVSYIQSGKIELSVVSRGQGKSYRDTGRGHSSARDAWRPAIAHGPSHRNGSQRS